MKLQQKLMMLEIQKNETQNENEEEPESVFLPTIKGVIADNGK